MIIVSYLICQRRYPQHHAESSYKIPGGVPRCTGLFSLFRIRALAARHRQETTMALAAFPLWLVIVVAG